MKFIRFDHISRHGPTSTRSLYRAIQEEVGSSAADAKAYARRLKDSSAVYLAIRDPESAFWGDTNNQDVTDSLMAYRRFGLESSMPLLLAAFGAMTKVNATKLMVKIVNWSIRSLFAGRLGAELAEDTFGAAAKAVATKEAPTQAQVRDELEALIPSDPQFERAFADYGALDNSRAKYLLAMLERAHAVSQSKQPQAISWTSSAVTVEHILAQSDTESEAAPLVKTIGNLTLLQRKGNRDMDSKPFAEKVATYADSEFPLTQEVAETRAWGAAEIKARTAELAKLATRTWPDQ